MAQYDYSNKKKWLGGGLFLLIIFSIVGIGFSGFSVPIEDNATLQVSVAEYKNLDLSQFVTVGDVTVFRYGTTGQTSPSYAIDNNGAYAYDGNISFPVTFKMKAGIADYFDTNEITLTTQLTYTYSDTDASLFTYFSSDASVYSFTYIGTSGTAFAKSAYIDNSTSSFTVETLESGSAISNSITFKVPTFNESVTTTFENLTELTSVTYNVYYNFNFNSYDNLATAAPSLANITAFKYEVIAP